jgi:hypothetical protein
MLGQSRVLDVKRFINFLWPFGAYRDVNCGTLLERAAAARHNKTLSRSLPTYINRWALSASVELILTEVSPAFIVPVFAFLFSISVCLLAHLIQTWLLFKRLG